MIFEASKSSLNRSFMGVGSSRLKPEVRKEASKSSLIRSFTGVDNGVLRGSPP